MTERLHSGVIWFVVFLIGCMGCKNRDVNEGTGPNFNEIHEDMHYHFDKVSIEGSEYHILERDRNNPHEGFGFMALNGADIKTNQDSIKAYLKTILDFQIRITSQLEKVSEKDIEHFSNEMLKYHIRNSRSPIYLENESLEE